MHYINILKQELGSAKTYRHNVLDGRSVIDRHQCHMTANFGVFVNENHGKLPTLYWLITLLPSKMPVKSHFIAYSSSCTTTELSVL